MVSAESLAVTAGSRPRPCRPGAGRAYLKPGPVDMDTRANTRRFTTMRWRQMEARAAAVACARAREQGLSWEVIVCVPGPLYIACWHQCRPRRH